MSDNASPGYRFVSYRMVEDRHGKRIVITERNPTRAASSPPRADTAGPAAAADGGAGDSHRQEG